MNDTPQGDGNRLRQTSQSLKNWTIRMNDTPQGDGNLKFNLTFIILDFK